MALITIEISTARREWVSLDEIQESWIAQQITRRQRDGQPVCVRVDIHSPQINVTLRAGQCNGRGGGGDRLPNEYERPVIDLWNARTDKNGMVHPGEIDSFFKQLRRLL